MHHIEAICMHMYTLLEGVAVEETHLSAILISIYMYRHRAKKHAEEQAEQMYFAKYQPDQYQPPPQDWSYGTGLVYLLF